MSAVATVHFLVWFSAFRAVFEAVDTGGSFPVAVELVLAAVLNILGAPLMFLLYLRTSGPGAPGVWWGDDPRLVVGLAMSNSLIWGCAVVWAYRLVRRRTDPHLPGVE